MCSYHGVKAVFQYGYVLQYRQNSPIYQNMTANMRNKSLKLFGDTSLSWDNFCGPYGPHKVTVSIRFVIIYHISI